MNELKLNPSKEFMIDALHIEGGHGGSTHGDIEKHLEMIDKAISDLMIHTNHLDSKLNSDVKYLMGQIQASENECKRLIRQKDHLLKKWINERLWYGLSVIGLLTLTIFFVYRSLGYWFD